MNFIFKLKDQSIMISLKEPQLLLTSIGFNRNLPLVILITGWTSTTNDSSNQVLDKIYTAYRCRGDHNFVVCFILFVSKYRQRCHRCIFIIKVFRYFQLGRWYRWVDAILSKAKRQNCDQITVIQGPYIATFYTWSALNTDEIGSVLSDALQELITMYPLEKIHLIGHSLGAHSKFS